MSRNVGGLIRRKRFCQAILIDFFSLFLLLLLLSLQPKKNKDKWHFHFFRQSIGNWISIDERNCTLNEFFCCWRFYQTMIWFSSVENDSKTGLESQSFRFFYPQSRTTTITTLLLRMKWNVFPSNRLDHHLLIVFSVWLTFVNTFHICCDQQRLDKQDEKEKRKKKGDGGGGNLHEKNIKDSTFHRRTLSEKKRCAALSSHRNTNEIVTLLLSWSLIDHRVSS